MNLSRALEEAGALQASQEAQAVAEPGEQGEENKDKKEKKRFSLRAPKERTAHTVSRWIFMLGSIVCGLASWLICYSLYDLLLDRMPRHFLIGLIFAVLYFMLAVLTLCYHGTLYRLLERTCKVLVMTAVVFALAALFQRIYGVNVATSGIRGVVSSGATSYVFVVDDSGSTQWTDPQRERYGAIETVLAESEEAIPYMVYGFSDGVELLRGMAPASGEEIPAGETTGGGTSIRAALTQVIDDYEAGVWEGGSAPRVILLTDGYAGDINILHPVESVLWRYVAANISVCTVGFAEADESLMYRIAANTGGTYVRASEAGDLAKAIRRVSREPVTYVSGTRDLLTTRYEREFSLLFGILRGLCLAILGLIIEGFAAISFGVQDAVSLTFPFAEIKAILGAVLAEVCMQLLGLPSAFVWLGLWVLWSVTILKKQGDGRGKPAKRKKK